MAPTPTLQELIETVRRDAATDEPLDQLSTAATAVSELAEVGDGVLSHYVDRARRAGCSWTDISGALGVSKQAAHKRFAAPRPPGLDRFTDRARHVLEAATEVARELGHPYVGTEHLLLGLFTEPDGVAAKVLAEAGIDRAAVAREVLTHAPRRDERPTGSLPYTPRAAAVIEGTVREALQLGHDYVGTEHLLLALYVEPVIDTGSSDPARGGGVAAVVLAALGLDRDVAHAHVVEKLSGYRARR